MAKLTEQQHQQLNAMLTSLVPKAIQHEFSEYGGKSIEQHARDAAHDTMERVHMLFVGATELVADNPNTDDEIAKFADGDNALAASMKMHLHQNIAVNMAATFIQEIATHVMTPVLGLSMEASDAKRGDAERMLPPMIDSIMGGASQLAAQRVTDAICKRLEDGDTGNNVDVHAEIKRRLAS